MFFRAIFNCRNPKVGIIKLEWWVEAIFSKNPEERGEFKPTEPLKYHVVKNGWAIVKLFLSVLRMESRNYWGILGKFYFLKNPDGQNSMPPKWLNYPEILSGPNKATTDARNLFHLNGCRSTNFGWKKFVANQHKLFALNIIVLVDFLFLKHFFYANEDKIACFCLFSWTLRTVISSFATENIIKFLPNWVFLLLYWM